ncbi:MAG TPA: hypothetical protein VIA45_04810 [Thermoanaerobaculia bacterium]|jgi:hypothetical protein
MRAIRRIPAATLALLLLAAASLRAEDKPLLRLRAFTIALQSGRSTALDIVINRWSTDEERESLLTTLQEFGQDKLLDALMKIRPPVGYMRAPNSLGYDLYYARDNAQPDGSRHIVAATNRRVAFREAASNTRSMQYQFTLIEIHLPQDGKNGEGKMVPAAKVSWDKDKKKLEIENYQALPVDLKSVSVQK